jgi:hypothetical protein
MDSIFSGAIGYRPRCASGQCGWAREPALSDPTVQVGGLGSANASWDLSGDPGWLVTHASGSGLAKLRVQASALGGGAVAYPLVVAFLVGER